MIFAGFPITILLSSINPFTTVPAPIIQFEPIIVPGSTIAPAPIKQFSPIVTALKALSPPPQQVRSF